MHEQIRTTLPSEHSSLTHKFSVGGVEGYLIFGIDENMNPRELFIKLNKTGTAEWSLYAMVGRFVSMLLQYGCPVESIVKAMRFSSFEPSGITANKDIRFAKSILDYIARYMELRWTIDNGTTES